MTKNDDQGDLKALFDRTSAEPSAFELTRMAARARELPVRLERVPRRLPRWSWTPAFATFAALGALGLTLTQALSPDEKPSPPAVQPAKVAPSAPPLEVESDPSARAAPASPAPYGSFGAPPADDDRELDDLPFAEEADDDPFDLSTAEETELLR